MADYLTEPPDLLQIFKRFKCMRDGNTVFIHNSHFDFTYHTTDILKEEFKDKYRYVGGLQSHYEQGSDYAKLIESKCIAIAEAILKEVKNDNIQLD